MPTDAAVRTEQVALSLRSAILTQSIRPGTPVTEAMVSDEFDVARPTARLAIERLVREGLLRREPHHAAYVPELDDADIADLFDNRIVIESAALGRLAASGTIPVAALSAHRALLIGAPEPAALDIAFHRALVAGQSSPRLARMHDTIMGEVELCIGQVFAEELIPAARVSREHQGIIDAVAAGDSDAASALAAAHVERTRDTLLEHYRAAHPALLRA